ncbi:unnamed protein product [Ilex paraguariensis]|uniref:Uncharacterized protein n=1 Tax=Ilex paraguariensis TaxID=185542 RepID=A0ABC8UB84_9AQUA
MTAPFGKQTLLPAKAIGARSIPIYFTIPHTPHPSGSSTSISASRYPCVSEDTDSSLINAIRDGLVVKIRNVDFCGKPAVVFRKLRDIYESDDATNLGKPSTLLQDRYDEVFHYDRFKMESPCLLMVDRRTKEKHLETNEFNCSDSADEKASDSDEHVFGKMTLEQLKERCKTRKRKFSSYVGLTPKQEPVEDEFDLELPLSSWKLKQSKNSKARQKSTNISVSTSKTSFLVKTEQILETEGSLPYSGDLFALSPIKTEVPGPESADCQNMISFSDDPSISHVKQAGSCEAVSGKIPKTVECVIEKREQILFAEECQNCGISEISYDHLNQVGSTSLFTPIDGEIMEISNQEKSCQQSSALPVSEFMTEEGIKHTLSRESFLESISPSKDQSSDMFNSSQSFSHLHNISRQSSSDYGVQIPGMGIDNTLGCEELSYGGHLFIFGGKVKVDLPPNLENSSLTPNSNCSSSSNSHPCSSPDNDLVSMEDDSPTTEDKQPIISTIDDAEVCCLDPDNQLVVSEDDATTDENQPSVSISADDGRNSSTWSHPCDVTDELSTSDIKNYRFTEQQRQSPERLLSTRKAISPTSQGRLCLALNSIELYDDVDNYKSKGKLLFGKDTKNKASPTGSDIHRSELSINPEGPVQVNRMNFPAIPKRMLKKLKNNRKGSPPKKGSPLKGSLEGPRLSRSLPRLSTSCTSIQDCSESSIAFSQRQMYDMEALAMKLMKELNSMKDIVEEKLLYEGYRSTLLKNDADEVKTAIKNATKAEESARRWLSMMTRDCNRFCKIMRLTGNGAADSKDVIHKERNKITFADEAGGTLCHIKVFEDSMVSQEPKHENQESEARSFCGIDCTL